MEWRAIYYDGNIEVYNLLSDLKASMRLIHVRFIEIKTSRMGMKASGTKYVPQDLMDNGQLKIQLKITENFKRNKILTENLTKVCD
jgi:hypothetical protein